MTTSVTKKPRNAANHLEVSKQTMNKNAGKPSKPNKTKNNDRLGQSAKYIPKVGDIVSGKVLVSGTKGVILLVDGGAHGRIKIPDISTRFMSGDDVAHMFPTQSVISDLTVSEVTPEGRLELKPKSRIGEPEVGSVHKAVVKRVEPYGLIMNFPNSLIRCLCVTEDIDDDSSQCKPALTRIQPGHKFNVKVTRIHQGKIWVSMKKSIVGEEFASNLPHVMEFQDPLNREIIDDTLDDVSDPELGADQSVAKRPKLIDTFTSAIAAPSASTSYDVMESEDVTTTQKTKKRQRDTVRKEKEQLIREKENQVLAGDWKRDPQTPDEFERLLLIEGKKSASAWIKYMSYYLKMAELGKAREVAERLVKCFGSLTDEQEKFNAWIAYLNMEAAFAPNLVDALFLRAVQYCDPKKVYHAMPQVWIRAGNQAEKAQISLEKMTNKFPESRKAWMNLIEFLFNENRFDEARALFPKALKSIPKRKHIRLTVKFAQFEYRNGNPERGSTIFEKLLSENNTAKTDIWSVYFDEHIKAHSGDLESVRNLFDRAIGMRLKPFKTKFFFKRWIDFESKFGNDDSVDGVKEKAVAYVASL